jgi:hypothetical protein
VTESEWLKATDPQAMLSFLEHGGRASERKMRLFAVACYWQVEVFHWDEPLFDAEVEAVGRYADGLIGRDGLLAASLAHYRQLFPGEEESALQFVSQEADYAAWMADWAAQRTRYAGEGAWPAGAAEAGQADLLRDIFGPLPFREVHLDLGWLTPSVLSIARRAYDERDFTALPVLADALADAGCDNEDLLRHCREPGLAHCRGCWIIDLLLGRS